MEAEKEWLAEDGVDDAGTISVNTDISRIQKQFIRLEISK